MRDIFVGIIAVLTVGLVSCQSDICEETQEWGFVCKDCQTMASCINLTGKWTSVTLGKCDNKSNLFCNRETRNCSTIKDCESTVHVEFTCNTAGIFPDPYNCNIFHACYVDPKISQLALTTIPCSKPSAFSPVSNECTAKMSDEICRKKQYSCSRIGDSGPWPGNANIFYICIESTSGANAVIYPALYRCPGGQNFTENGCVSQTTQPDASITTPTQQSPTAECKAEGLFRHPTNCTMYYYCNRRLQRMQYICPRNSHFNDTQKACVPGPC